ncbi:hypothetical protein QD460_29925 [Rhizobium jaguaris]|uniref:hypothetical protein n=1 Tax=Rhizobium jaguaris TaxID=1312183 RepID=UPI0039BF6159
MDNTTKLAGVGALACAACCAIPLLPAVGVGIGAGTGAIGFPLAVAAVLPLGLMLLHSRRRKEAAAGSGTMTLPTASSCGCGTGTTTNAQMPLIACTLDATDFKARTAEIQNIASRYLQRVSRQPLSIELTYLPAAQAQLRDLVRKETQCCAFLTFDLRERGNAVVLVITAPEEAGDAAHMLFDHFAPPIIQRQLENAQ